MRNIQSDMAGAKSSVSSCSSLIKMMASTCASSLWLGWSLLGCSKVWLFTATMFPVVLPTTKSGAEKRSVSLEPVDAGWLGCTFEKEKDLTGPASRSCNQAVMAEKELMGKKRRGWGGEYEATRGRRHAQHCYSAL